MSTSLMLNTLCYVETRSHQYNNNNRKKKFVSHFWEEKTQFQYHGENVSLPKNIQLLGSPYGYYVTQ